MNNANNYTVFIKGDSITVFRYMQVCLESMRSDLLSLERSLEMGISYSKGKLHLVYFFFTSKNDLI